MNFLGIGRNGEGPLAAHARDEIRISAFTTAPAFKRDLLSLPLFLPELQCLCWPHLLPR
jgi:hypothetical protein